MTNVLLKMNAQGFDAGDSRYRQAMKACTMANDPTQVIYFPFNYTLSTGTNRFFWCARV